MFSNFELHRDEQGKHGFGYNWWYNKQHPQHFQIFDLHRIYKEEYFQKLHESEDNIKTTLNLIKINSENLINTKISNVIEVGSGGGWFTKFLIKQYDFVTCLEGNNYGIKKLLEVIPKEKIIQQDLRTQSKLGLRFDLVICLETAEHIEPPFAGIFISNLCNFSDLIVFSSANEPHSNHIHHPNAQPIEYWDNIFAFYNFTRALSLFGSSIYRANCHFFKKI